MTMPGLAQAFGQNAWVKKDLILSKNIRRLHKVGLRQKTLS